MAGWLFNPKAETMPRAELESLQLELLRAQVRHVYENVPFYKKKFDDVGVAPDDIRTLADITRLPFTTKNDLRDNFPYGMMAVPLSECVELHASSGTTGTPVTVCYTRGDIEVWSEVMARCLAMSGLTKQDVFQNPIPYGTFTGAFGFHYGAQKVGSMVIPSGKGDSERQIKLMKDYGTTFISGVASYAVHLGQVALKMGIDPVKQLNVRNGLFGAEMFTHGIKDRLADVWGMDVHDIYGLTEMCGPGVSTDCDQHDGLHLWQDHFYAEIIDPATGEQVGIEEEGELVLTTLTKQGLPIIRYRTRDLTRLLDVPVCECGRTHVKHAPIKGRSDDMLILSGTNIYPGQIEAALMKDERVGANWRMVLTKKGVLDALTVEVETKTVLSPQEKDEMAASLAKEIKIILTFGPKVSILDPGGIEHAGIKAKRVLDLRGE